MLNIPLTNKALWENPQDSHVIETPPLIGQLGDFIAR
jgi:hypothetical protein